MLTIRRVTSSTRWILAAALCCAFLPQRLQAQGTDASIIGRVLTEAGVAVPEATVSVRNEATGFVNQRLTDHQGRFAFLQLPLGGPYTITARGIGYHPSRRGGVELHLGDRLPADFRLQRASVVLQEVIVSAEGDNARTERFGASTPISAQEIASIPADGRNFTDLAILSPLVGSGISIAGDKEVSTGISIDGLSARNNISGGVAGNAPIVMSLEAIREFEIITNVYDVSRGRQGGGALNAVTKSGTNEISGSIFTYHRNNRLAGADYTGRDPNQFSRFQWGGSLGGPIVRDKAHYFVSIDRQDESAPYRILDIQTDADANVEGISRDSVARLEKILRDKYGLVGTQTGAFTRKPVSTSAFGRIDWNVNPSHRLTMRTNLVRWYGEASDGTDQTLLEAYADKRSLTYAALVSVTSSLRSNVSNEFKVGLTSATFEQEPYTALPKGTVNIQSRLPNGNLSTTKAIAFGGNNTGFNGGDQQHNFQLVNTTQIDRGRQRFKFGIDQLLSDITVTQFLSRWGGTFAFANLAALDALKPTSYTRKVPLPLGTEPIAKMKVWDGAAFVQGEYDFSPRLRALVGLRWDVTSFLTAAEYNPLVEQLTGLRTDNNPTDWNNVQPRGEITWDRRGDGREVLRVGGGMFSAQSLYLNQANNILNPGNLAYDVSLTGTAVPTPNFPAYRQDPNSIPLPPQSAGAPQVNLISQGFQLPTSWKGNIAYQRLLGTRFTLGANLFFSRTSDNYHYFDRNLVDTPYFTIEGGRGVFVPAAKIATNGTLNAARDATKTPLLQNVRELVGVGEARQRGVVVEAGARLPRASRLNVAYTWNQTRDNSSYNCCAPATATATAVAGDPRDLSKAWGYSDFDFRHKITAYGSLPRVWGFRVSGRYIARSGTPVSLIIAGDPNGDGTSSNDLAFVFDPDDPATPATVAASMRKVLENPDNAIRDYIQNSVGGFAQRNGGRAPWRHNVDIRAGREFRFRGKTTELSLDVFNFGNLLNKSWGGFQSLSNKQTLYSITGFSQATQRYTYSVNENIGVIPQKSGSGYQMQLGARVGF
ncbi:MAG: TonB-dependent receptor [Gemmatimonadaceae bacterium]|nr:TonB-dependent receptor [Gemmatimonadaceae bacterium]